MERTMRGLFSRVAATLVLMLLTTVTAWAANVTVTSETTSWTDGNTYNVTSNVTITDRITVTGTVTLNLGAGATLTATKGITVNTGNSLTINGTGTLYAGTTNGTDNTCGSNCAGIGDGDDDV